MRRNRRCILPALPSAPSGGRSARLGGIRPWQLIVPKGSLEHGLDAGAGHLAHAAVEVGIPLEELPAGPQEHVAGRPQLGPVLLELVDSLITLD